MTRRIGVLEGFYGTPYTWEQRSDLLRWCAEVGMTDLVLSPKGDPLLRAEWRSAGDTTPLAALAALGREVGVDVGIVISPGLDWRGAEDHDALIAKARLLADAGVSQLAIAWDDVPRGGAELGRSHAAGVAAVAMALPDVRWSTCPTDYAVSTPTSYLQAFADGLPEGMAITWTGTGIVSDTLSADEAETLTKSLGRSLIFADNVPVNDGPMSSVLHLGPYPERDPRLPEVCDGLLLNLIPGMPLASRITADAAARWWRDPTRDREECWREALVPGIEPLARSCRSWLTDPGPDAELLGWALDDPLRLVEWLSHGCREGLAPEWQAELAGWLGAWELEALLMSFAANAAAHLDPVEAALGVAEGWRRIRAVPQQLFGIKHAMYPVTVQSGDDIRPSVRGLVRGESLSDVLCASVLAALLQ